MKVTVCELRDSEEDLRRDWGRLAAHVRTAASDVVLLPEMPFAPWVAHTRRFDPAVWQAAVAAHEAWQRRFDELAPAAILGSRPVTLGGRRLNEGFVWAAGGGRGAHHKYYLPDDEGFWEASWYQRGDGDFAPVDFCGLRFGFLICTELWFFERARFYGRNGVDVIVNPRASGKHTVEKWLVGGRAAAVVSGAFCLSSNRAGTAGGTTEFGGRGWVVGPDGDILAMTSRRQPFVTVDIDPQAARLAKGTYPRYVAE